MRKPFLLLILIGLTSLTAFAQRFEQPALQMDSITYDMHQPNQYAPAARFFQDLQAPRLYVLNGQALPEQELSQIAVTQIESIRIVQDPEEIRALGYTEPRSLILIKTKEE